MAGRRISELFFELRAKTEGLDRDIKDSERQLDKFSQFVARNPTAVVGALGLALVGVAVQAMRMAEEVDRSVRRMVVNLPEGRAGIDALKDGITSVSNETGKLRSETQSLFELISKQGVSSAEEIETRALAIERFSDATATSSQTTAGGLDQLMDAFGITADGAELALAKIASVTKGRQDVESVIDALQSAAPSVAKFGLSYDDTLRALISLMDGFGLSAGQAGKTLRTLDKEGLQELAKGGHIAADALQDMTDRANIMREGSERAGNKIRNEFSATMENLGARILPLVNAELQGLVGILDALMQRDSLPLDAIGATVESIAKRAHGQARLKATEDNDLRGALSQIVGGSGISAVLSPEKVASLSAAQRKVLQDGLELFAEYSESAGLTAQQIAIVTKNLTLLEVESVKGLGAASTTAVERSAETGSVGTGRKVLPLTSEQKKAATDGLLEIQKAVTEFGVATQKTIAGTTKSAVDNAIAQYAALALKITETRAIIQKKATLPGIDAKEIAAQLKALDDAGRKALEAQHAIIAQATLEERQTIADAVAAAAASATGNAAGMARVAIEKQTSALLAQIAASKVLDASEKRRLATEVTLADQIGHANADAQESAAKLVAIQLRIDNARQSGVVPDASTLNALNAASLNASQRMRELEAEGLTNSQSYRDYQAQILEIENKRKGIVTQIVKAGTEAATAAEKQLRTTQENARALQQAVDGAIQLAAAFGLVGNSTSDVLRSVSQIAAGIRPLIDQLKALKKGTTDKDGNPLASITSVVGAALPVVGGLATLLSVSGLFGDSAADQANRARLVENTAALQQLTQKVGLIGSVALPGSSTAIATAQRFADAGALDTQAGGLNGIILQLVKSTDTAEFLRFVEAAKLLGVTVEGTTESVAQGVRAILAASGKLGEFGDDFASFQSQAEAARKIFSLDNPAQIITDLATASAKASPALKALFEGLDLTKPEDLEALRARVQAFFTTMEAGGEKLTPEQLGSLTGDQLVQYLVSIISGIDSLVPAVETAAQRFAKVRSGFVAEFEILDVDAPHQLEQIGAHYASLGGAFAGLMDGLDPVNNEADIDVLHQRIKALFQQFEDAPGSVDLAGLSIDEFVAALLDLDSAVGSAASGVKTAAQMFADAADTLNTDFEIFGTDAAGQASATVDLYKPVGGIADALKGLDLSTAAGREAGKKALQDLYASHKDDAAQTEGIRAILRTWSAIPEATDEGDSSVAIRAGAGESSRSTSGAERITVQQADRVGNLLESILVRATETATNTRTLALLDRMLRVPTFAPIQPPAGGSASLGMSGGMVLNVRIAMVNNFNGAGSTPAAQAAAQAIGTKTVDEINRALGKRYANDRLMSGNPVAGSS